MLASYHNHTARCLHAVGADEEYVKAAINAGIKILGFSDHAPMPYPVGYESYYKMRREELSEYCSSILALKERYADKIEIHLGLETEYYPEIFDKSLEFWRDYPIEYLILGQHFAYREWGEGRLRSIEPSDSPEKLKLYTDTIIKGIETAKMTYVAHPDVLWYTGSDIDLYRSEAARIITAANEMGIPLEINLLGIGEGREYPRTEFWQEAGALGAKAIIGVDAHSPERMLDKKELSEALRLADKCGVEVLETVELINPFV